MSAPPGSTPRATPAASPANGFRPLALPAEALPDGSEMPMKPGAKADCVIILEGLQGRGKSTALSILGGEWFMDTPFPLGDKEAFQQIRGKWLIELGELDGPCAGASG